MVGRWSWLGVTAGVLVAACATGSRAVPPRPELAPQAARELERAEQLYRAGDPAFAAERDRLAAAPETAYWLAAMLVRDVVWAYDHRRVSDESFLRAALGRRDPVTSRALEQLRAMGQAAVPCVIESLLASPYADRRRLGTEILAAIGPRALPELRPVLEEGDDVLRRHAVEALAMMEPAPAVLERLERAARDPLFAVRAAALEGLARAGERYAPLLRAALEQDADPFVRRAAARALGGFTDRATAAALVEYYGDCLEAGDQRGVVAADESLRRISGRERPADLAAWKAWLADRSATEGR